MIKGKNISESLLEEFFIIGVDPSKITLQSLEKEENLEP